MTRKTGMSSAPRAAPRIREGRACVALLMMVAALLWRNCAATPADEQQANLEASYELDINTDRLDLALTALAQQTNVQLLFPFDVVSRMTAQPVVGRYTVAEALALLLADSALESRLTSGGVIAISPREAANNTSRGATMSGNPASSQSAAQPRQRNPLAKIGAALSAIFLTPAGHAQEPKQVEQWMLEEVVVTAQKRVQRAQDVPFAVFAQSGQQLEERGIDDLQSLQVAVPGLLVSESGSFQRRISIRGIGNAFGSSSLVGIYVDEAPVTTIPSNQLDLRIFDLERVEVLKGPQGTLYGEGSVGGTIRYITRNPDLNGFGGSVSLDTASIQDGSFSTQARGVVNVPVNNQLGVRIAAQYVDFGGWIDQPALGGNDINSYELFNVRTKVLWQPSEDLQLVATAITHRNDGRAQNMGEDEQGNYTQAFNDPTTPTSKDDYDIFNVTAQYDFGGFSLLSSTSHMDTDRAVHDLGNACCVPLASGDGYWNLLFYDFAVSSSILTQELRLMSESSGPISWTFGGFYRDADTTPSDISNGFLFGQPGGTPGVNLFTFGPSAPQEISRSWAAFGELGYDLTSRLETGIGLRYFEDERRFRAALSGPHQEGTFTSVNRASS